MAIRLAEITVMYENNESLCCIPGTDIVTVFVVDSVVGQLYLNK